MGGKGKQEITKKANSYINDFENIDEQVNDQEHMKSNMLPYQRNLQNQNVRSSGNASYEKNKDKDELTGTEHRIDALKKMSKNSKILKMQTKEQRVVEEMALSLNNSKKNFRGISRFKMLTGPKFLTELSREFDVFDADDYEGSNTSTDMKDAISRFKNAWKYFAKDSFDDEPGAFETMVNAVLDLNEAAYAYVLNHTYLTNIHTKKFAAPRKESALNIRRIVARITESGQWKTINKSIDDFNGIDAEEKDLAPRVITDDMYSDSKKQLKNLSVYYDGLNDNIIADKFDTTEEKLKKRFDVLKRYKKYMDIYQIYREETGKKTEVPWEIRHVINVYNHTERQLEFIKWSKRNGNANLIQPDDNNIFLEKRIRNEESVNYSEAINEEDIKFQQKENIVDYKELDKGVSKAQEAGLEEIDKWLIRNYNNGGMIGTVLSFMKNNNSDFVLNILSKSKRERLYLYYMIETKARNHQSVDDVVKSQVYVPTLSGFKKQMLATKWKFMSRAFGGGYTYWHKMDQSIELLNIRRDELLAIYAPYKNAADDTIEYKRKREAIKLENLLNEYKTLLSCKDSMDEETFNETVGSKIKEVEKVIYDVIGDLTDGGEYNRKKKVRMTDQEIKQFKTNVEYANYLNHRPTFVKAVDFCTSKTSSLALGLNVGVQSGSTIINAAANVFSLATQVAVILNSAGHLSNKELGIKVIDAINTLGTTGYKTAQSIKGIGDVFNYSNVMGMTTPVLETFGQTVGSMAVGARAIQIGNEFYKGYQVHNVNKAFEEKYKNQEISRHEKESRYDMNMAKLINKTDAKNKVTLALNSVATALSCASAFVIPLSIWLISISLGMSCIAGTVNGMMQSSVSRTLFDDFFGVQDIYKDFLARKKGWIYDKDSKAYFDADGMKHTANELKAADEKEFLSMLRNKIARMRGFSSISGAATMISSKYSTFILDKLFKKPYAPDRDLYVRMVKSYGLKIKESDNPDDRRPTHTNLARKITGRV